MQSVSRSGPFSPDYKVARGRFLAASEAAGAELSAYLHPARGSQGEELAIDVAVLGPAGATHAIVVASGTHGVEGFAGSGIQLDLLQHREAWLADLPVALVLVHAHNPHGFSWVRRTNEDNIDLNRNFIDFDAGLPQNQPYAEVHPLLIPGDWEGPAHNRVRVALRRLVQERGERDLAMAISGGQWSHPDGLFYGGQGPSFTNQVVPRLCRQELAGFERVGLIDLHTGLGPRGHGELIFPGSMHSAEYRRLVDWYGPEVTSSLDGTSASAPVQGTIDEGYREALLARIERPTEDFSAVVLEFGTEPLWNVLEALMGDNWLHLSGNLASEQGQRIKTQLKRALFGEDETWQGSVLERSREVAQRMAQGLAQA